MGVQIRTTISPSPSIENSKSPQPFCPRGNINLIGASTPLATVTMTLDPNTLLLPKTQKTS